jgi:hypothetical protein
MIAKKLRIVATAFFMGAVAVTAAGVLTATPAEAAAVRPAVGKPLQAAINAAKAGHYDEAMSQLRKAEAIGGLSAEEQKIVNQTHDFIAVKSGGSVGVNNAVTAQAKFDTDYRARRYADVIKDADMLRKYNALNTRNMQVIAQAYYLMRDFKGCVKYTKSIGGPALELQMRCAYDAHDDATYRDTLEKLVSATNKPEYWARLIKFSEGAKALSDQQSLDIYRIKYLTKNVQRADDYFAMAQFALQFGFAAEAKGVIDAGMKAGVLKDVRAQRIAKMANDTLASNMRNLPRTVREANASKTGDLLIKLGQDYCGMNRGSDAVAAVKAGIAKGVSDPDNAQIRLGHAYFVAGQKAQALAAFAKVKSKGTNAKLTADLWSLYVRSH